jgi:TP901 family phage tail tape measure protein
VPGEVRSVRARLSLEVAQAIAGADRFGASMERNAARAERAGARVDRSSARTGRAWDMVGRGARNTFLVGAAGLAVMERANYTFDKSMGTVNAATHANAKVMDEYRQAAIKAGADTVFSSSEAAQGITELAKAGVQAKDILGGGLTGALNLAAAGGLGVGQSAEYMATALTQFQLKGSKATHVADLLAAGAGKAQGEVSDMALALTYAGVPSNQLGVSLEQTAGTIALLAKNGIIGERAGTSLRGMLASLTSPSKIAQKSMDALGISVFDAKGNFIGFDGVARVLHDRLSGLTQKERSYALGRIFGNEQLQAANVLYREGAKGVHTWTKNVDDSGYAADTAKRKLNNLAGDVEYLKGDIDALFIKRGGGAQDGLRDLVQGVDRAVVAFGHLPDEVQSGVVKVTALTTATAGLLFVASKVVKTYRGVRDVFGATKAGSGLGAVAGAAASKSVVPVYVTNWAGGSLPGGKGVPGAAPVPVAGKARGSKLARAGGLIVDAAVVLASAKAISSLGEAIGKLGDRGREAGVLDQFTKPKSGLNALLFGGGHTIKHDANAALHADSIGGKADKFLAGLVGGDGFTKSLGNIKKLDAALADLQHKHPDKAADAYQAVLKKTGLSAEQLNKILPKTADAMGLVSKATEKAQKAQLDANGKLKAGTQLYGAGGVNVSKYAEKLQLLPAAVQKAVLAEKATTQGQIDSLTRRFDLTPIQVKALVTLAGGKEAISDAHRTALAIAHELDMTRPDKADRPKTPEKGPIKGGGGNLLLAPVMDTSKYKAVIDRYRRDLKNIPAAVMTKIETPGAIQSLSQVRALGRQYGLTPKQVRTVARLVNAALVRAGLSGLIGLANTLDKKRVNPKVSADTSKARAQLNSFGSFLTNLTRPRSVSVTANVHTGNTGPVSQLTKKGTGGYHGGTVEGTGRIRRHFAAGGTVPGSGPYRDSVLALLAPTEEIIPNDKGQADRYRADRGAGRIPAYAAGGTVAAGSYSPGAGITVQFPAPDTRTTLP